MQNKAIGLALWGNEPISETVRHAQLAEAAGFDGIWLVDSQLICREIYVTLTACALATTTLRLATGVTLPRTRHVSVTASALATLRELSGDRVSAGISVGNTALRTIGQRPARIAELEDYVNSLRTLLSGQRSKFGEGAEGQIEWLSEAAPIALNIAATGPRLTRAAARFGDGVILLQGAANELIEQGLALVDAGLRDAGRAEDDVDVIAWVYVGIDDDEERARDQVRGRVAAVMQMSDATRFHGEDRVAIETLQRDYDVFAHATASPEHARLVPDRFIDRYAIAGCAQQVRERFAQLLANPRIKQIVVSPQVAGAQAPRLQDFIERFAAAVLEARQE